MSTWWDWWTAQQGVRLLTSSALCGADIQKATGLPGPVLMTKLLRTLGVGRELQSVSCGLFLVATSHSYCCVKTAMWDRTSEKAPIQTWTHFLSQSTAQKATLDSVPSVKFLQILLFLLHKILGYFYSDGREERNLTMYECYNLCLWWDTASSSGELQKVVLWKGIIHLSWKNF